MYFKYGIKNSSLEENEPVTKESNAGNIELKVTDASKSPSKRQKQPSPQPDRSIYESQQLDSFGQPVFGSTNFGGTPTEASSTQQTSSSKLFVHSDSFPSWDD